MICGKCGERGIKEPHRHNPVCPGPADEQIARLRSHVSRLEESLRVALEARTEVVEVLGAVIARVDALRFHRDDAGVVTVQECDDLATFTAMVEDFDRARRAIGKGE